MIINNLNQDFMLFPRSPVLNIPVRNLSEANRSNFEILDIITPDLFVCCWGGTNIGLALAQRSSTQTAQQTVYKVNKKLKVEKSKNC